MQNDWISILLFFGFVGRKNKNESMRLRDDRGIGFVL